jgi:hypothetical protein
MKGGFHEARPGARAGLRPLRPRPGGCAGALGNREPPLQTPSGAGCAGHGGRRTLTLARSPCGLGVRPGIGGAARADATARALGRARAPGRPVPVGGWQAAEEPEVPRIEESLGAACAPALRLPRARV